MEALPTAPSSAPAPHPPAPTHLVLSGGGLSGLAYIGVLRFLATERADATIRHVSGTSMGAFFATAFALRVPSDELEATGYKIFRDTEYTHYPPTALLGLLQTYGMDDGSRFRRPLERYGGADINFRDLAKRFGRHLVICATCLDTMKPVYFSSETTPDVSVLTAMIASMAIPFLIQPVRIGDRHYIDGAFTDNVPYAPFLRNGRPRSVTDTLLICDIRNIPAVAQPIRYPCGHVLEFIQLILNIVQKNYTPADPHAHISLSAPVLIMSECPLPLLRFYCDESGVYFNVPTHDIDASVVYGFRVTQSWFNGLRKQPEPSKP